jgi:hypothetical protein
MANERTRKIQKIPRNEADFKAEDWEGFDPNNPDDQFVLEESDPVPTTVRRVVRLGEIDQRLDRIRAKKAAMNELFDKKIARWEKIRGEILGAS